MLYLEDSLTGNCFKASVLSGRAIDLNFLEAGLEGLHVAGVTGKRLNCGRKRRELGERDAERLTNANNKEETCWQSPQRRLRQTPAATQTHTHTHATVQYVLCPLKVKTDCGCDIWNGLYHKTQRQRNMTVLYVNTMEEE